MVVVPNKVPCPVIENVREFVVVVTVLFSVSWILAVIKDVLLPFGTILVEDAVTAIFTGTPTDVTFTVPSLKLADVDRTVAVPVVRVDCKVTVA